MLPKNQMLIPRCEEEEEEEDEDRDRLIVTNGPVTNNVCGSAVTAADLPAAAVNIEDSF